MRLTDQEASRFYAAWWPLLGWINERLGIVPGVTRFPCAVEDAIAIRDALWAHDDLRVRFVAENPAGLPADQLALVASWQHRRAGTFIVWKHHKKHTVLLGQGEAFEVVGLCSSLEEILPVAPPVPVEAVLLPFEGRIVLDGLLRSYDMLIGPNMRGSLREEYRALRARGAVLAALPKAAEAARPADAARDRGSERAVRRPRRIAPSAG